jgi:ElaB/YqjD/DUF883 family membrane-anchored ribosome-binding protein
MSKQTTTTSHDLGALAEDVRALIAATADVASEQVTEARKRLASALSSGKDILECVRDKAVEGARATDTAVRDHPYEAMGIALGVGALIGYLGASRCSHRRD